MRDFDQALPQSQEAERAILGAILQDSATLALAQATLAAEDFFLPRHQLIFRSFERLHASARPSTCGPCRRIWRPMPSWCLTWRSDSI